MTPTSTETCLTERYRPHELPDLMAHVKSEKRTGQLVISFKDGGMAACEWRQTIKPAPAG